jgi:hypothetical protein
MATPISPVFFGADTLERSVWVVIDPRDFVTGERMVTPVIARLKDVTAEPIAGRSGVYCFMDLNLPAGTYTAQVQPRPAQRGYYFDGEASFTLATVPVPGQPLNRNRVLVELLPRPAYVFADGATLARGRLVRASDETGIDRARIFLILDSTDLGRRGVTDERGEFLVFFPRTPPEDTSSAGLKDLKFQLRFEIDGQPPLVIAEETVREGTTIALGQIEHPGI